ncbi:MAG: outer membrane protein assembly factor BamD [Terriglobales bacterium]|jgi:outer membrane protein assembly factor BamD
MLRRTVVIVLLAGLAFTTACTTNKKATNPLADVSSKQPDKVLFDRAMDALKHNRYDLARLTLQTLINTYPDSEFIARAKLAVADSWYDEGGSTAIAQAEIEYKDFITFFPNMPEAAEAQLKIANIHYQEMEKPDRDYTHAMRAEEEYRQLIMQWPDSKLIPEAKQRLREVQEVIGEREFGVGRFYYLRESYPAAIARLQSLVDKYPLYSKADEALYLLGQSYESEITLLHNNRKLNEAAKAYLIKQFTERATEAYSRIITRYPVMERSDSAKARLVALHQPVPKPTKAAVAQNKAEEDSRKEDTALSKVMRAFAKHPNVAEAAKLGEPTLVDPTPMSASAVSQPIPRTAPGGLGGDKSVSIETVNGAPAANENIPRSDAPPRADATATPDATANPASAPAEANELQPNVAPADANELKPNVPADGNQALPPPQQVNEIQGGNHPAASAANPGTSTSSASSTGDQDTADDATVASSKHKKKKGIHKIVPF